MRSIIIWLLGLAVLGFWSKGSTAYGAEKKPKRGATVKPDNDDRKEGSKAGKDDDDHKHGSKAGTQRRRR